MQYLLLIYGDEAHYEAMSQDALGAMMADFTRYTEALAAAGVLRGGSELAPVRTATTVRLRGGQPVCTDGPFAETKEQLGGYYLIEVPDLDAAIAWAARCPAAASGSIEIRPQV